MAIEDLTLRPANRDDLPLLLDLYADMDGHAPLPLAQGTDLFEAVQSIPNYGIYLAFDPDQAVPIGTFSLLEIPTFMHHGYHKAALLDAVSIRSHHRGKGYGRVMIHQALQLAQRANCYKVTLSTNLARPQAHDFYIKLGFKQHGWSFSCIL